jgi:septum formation protein
VVYNFQVFGKPKNKAQAVSFLRKLSGKKHYVLSCVAIQARKDNTIQKLAAVERTAVYFRKLSEAEIAAYAESAEPYDKAGGYGIQGKAKIFVKKICGCYDNVVGLPVYKFLLLLARLKRR